MLTKLILILTIASTIINLSCAISCKNENNENIDWFIGLKFPGRTDFVYLSSDTKTWSWTVPKYNLSNNANLIGLTIKQTYSTQNSSSFYAYYNDESPQINQYSYRGHLKGVVHFDSLNGFWLIHSVPKFPYVGKYQYGKSQVMYAQSFICVSLSTQNLEPIISQLLIMQSTVYSYNLPSQFPTDKDLRNLMVKFVNNQDLINRKKTQVISLKASNLALLHFGKSAEFGNDLYAGLLAPYLKSSILVESWIRGDKEDSACNSNYKVYNVETVNLLNKSFMEHEDHSKWAVSKDQKNPFVCIGDINRMTSQFKRGGGTLCVQNLNIWKVFYPIVTQYEGCRNPILSVLPEFKVL